MSEDEDILETGHPLLSGRARVALLGVAVLAVAGVIVARTLPRSGPSHDAAAVPSTPAATQPASPSGSSPASTGPSPGPPRPWPTAAQGCGGDTDLPIVSSQPRRQSTGLRLLVGGSRLRTVDFDSGRVTASPAVALGRDEFVVAVGAGADRYAVAATCPTQTSFGTSRLIRLGADGRARSAPLPDADTTVLADGERLWLVARTSDERSRGTIRPADGGAVVRLPAGFVAEAITHDMVVGSVGSPAAGTSSVLLVDARTGHVRADFGAGRLIAAGSGVVVWADRNCELVIGGPCSLHARRADGAATRDFRIPRPPGPFGGIVSADGRLLAFGLQRAGQDPRYEAGHPMPPTDLAILHLDGGTDTGAVDIVPKVEIPAKTGPGLAFSADGQWLVLALNAGTKTRLLAWRPGLRCAYESSPVEGLAYGQPPLAVLERG